MVHHFIPIVLEGPKDLLHWDDVCCLNGTKSVGLWRFSCVVIVVLLGNSKFSEFYCAVIPPHKEILAELAKVQSGKNDQ